MRGALETDAAAYMRSLNALTDAEAKPWTLHPAYGAAGARFCPADSSFRNGYGEMV